MQHPHVTCIVEWENASALERDAARLFLDGIGKRLSEFGKTSNLSIEILLVFDEDVSEDDLLEDVAACPSLENAQLPVRLLYTPEASYYEKRGLRRSTLSLKYCCMVTATANLYQAGLRH